MRVKNGHPWWVLSLLIIGILIGACDPASTSQTNSGPVEASFVPRPSLPRTWLEAPLDNTVVSDASRPIQIVGNTAAELDDPELLIEQDGIKLPSLKLDINAFQQERPGDTVKTIRQMWVLPDLAGEVTTNEVVYIIRLRINSNHGLTSKPVRIRRIVKTPTPTITRTSTSSRTPSATATSTQTSTQTATSTLLSTTPTTTITATSTPTLTATLTATSTATNSPSPTPTITVQPSPTSTPMLTLTPTPTPGECEIYVSGNGSQQQANIRSGPGTVYPIYKTLTPKDGRFKVTGKFVYPNGVKWWQIQYTDKLKGFVSADFVTAEGACDDVPDVPAPPPPKKTATPTYTPIPQSSGGGNPPPPPGGGGPPPAPTCVPSLGPCTDNKQCCSLSCDVKMGLCGPG